VQGSKLKAENKKMMRMTSGAIFKVSNLNHNSKNHKEDTIVELA